MGVRQFQTLLDAAMRWRVRDVEMAMLAATMPHLKDDARRQVVASLRAAQRGGIDADTGEERNVAALAQMKAAAAHLRRRYPLDEATRKLLRKGKG